MLPDKTLLLLNEEDTHAVRNLFFNLRRFGCLQNLGGGMGSDTCQDRCVHSLALQQLLVARASLQKKLIHSNMCKQHVHSNN